MRAINQIAGTLGVIIGLVLCVFGVIAALQGVIGTGVSNLVLGIAFLAAGTVGTTVIDKKIKAKRARDKTIAAQTSEFD